LERVSMNTCSMRWIGGSVVALFKIRIRSPRKESSRSHLQSLVDLKWRDFECVVWVYNATKL
jgi:uncharacterized membrane protein